MLKDCFDVNMVYYRIPRLDIDLLSECDFETYRSSGPGGQNVNRRETAVRLYHRPSGIVISCQEERSQHRNKQIALQRLRHRLQKLNRRQKKRVPTKMPKNVREKILSSKKQQSQKKSLRKKPPFNE